MGQAVPFLRRVTCPGAGGERGVELELSQRPLGPMERGQCGHWEGLPGSGTAGSSGPRARGWVAKEGLDIRA